MNCDYGHQNYLDILDSRRSIIVRAVERLERRTAEVLYEKAKWFKWVRECQDTEEQQRENEKKKVKEEAALFKRHMKEVELRMKELRAKEDLKRQQTNLEEAYNEALSQEEREAEWDPIEDVIGDERGNHVDLIKHILFMTNTVDELTGALAKQSADEDKTAARNLGEANETKSSGKSKKSRQKVLTNAPGPPQIPDKAAHDTRSQVHRRLKEGVKIHYEQGMHLVGSIDNPVELKDKTAPYPEDEIDSVLNDMTEIKHLLFCRLLLSHTTILPAAI